MNLLLLCIVIHPTVVLGQQKEIMNKSRMDHWTVKPIPKDLPDMPLKSDLIDIMNSINMTLDFFMKNKNDIDISMNFGLFLLSVNLQTVLVNKFLTLPKEISINMKQLLESTNQLLKFFESMVESDNNPDDSLSKTLTSLFNYKRLWMFNLKKFDGKRVNETATAILNRQLYNKLERRYSKWDKYTHDVEDFEKAVPSPYLSNKCLSYLANNHPSDSWKKDCNTPVQCKKPLANGSEYGYGLTHRLLYLQLAYYGYSCHVFSKAQDQKMRRDFCKKMYAEASYISMNGYGFFIDLFVEQLCLCALDGHFQFLRRTWLLTIIGYQMDVGCFSHVPSEKRTKRPQNVVSHQNWKLDKGENQFILGGHCNVHTSSAAVATLGFGVKFILETHY